MPKSYIESEKKIEAYLRGEIKKRGGMCLKLLSDFFRGLPDRLCLLPGAKLFFAEIKTTKKKPTKIQQYVHGRIRKLGFKVHIIDTTDGVDRILEVLDYEN